MLVTRRLEIEALILALLTVLRAGVQFMAFNGKSRLILAEDLQGEVRKMQWSVNRQILWRIAVVLAVLVFT